MVSTVCWAHELHQPLRRWSQLDVRADRPSAEHGHATNIFVGSAGGGRSAAIAYTLVETAKLNGINPQAWLTEVLGRIADHILVVRLRLHGRMKRIIRTNCVFWHISEYKDALCISQ